VVIKSSTFWDITPCSPLTVNRHFRGTHRLHLQGRLSLPPAFTLISCSAYSTTKMEAIRSSETSADFQRTTWNYIPEDITLLFHTVSMESEVNMARWALEPSSTLSHWVSPAKCCISSGSMWEDTDFRFITQERQRNDICNNRTTASMGRRFKIKERFVRNGGFDNWCEFPAVPVFNLGIHSSKENYTP
jgi:hypothetical protein